jgi:hypothetical protein
MDRRQREPTCLALVVGAAARTTVASIPTRTDEARRGPTRTDEARRGLGLESKVLARRGERSGRRDLVEK